MAGKIFISYRRSETAWVARALFERLWRDFPDRVFIDIEGLSLGIDYTKVIDDHLDGCEVMLALIGPSWLAEIQRRSAAATDLDEDNDEPDWVRAELSRALARDIPVVPVLIDGTQLPAKRELPAEIKGLRHRHGLELHARFFDDQAGRLVREIGKVLSVAPAIDPPPIARAPAASIAPAAPPMEPWMSRQGQDTFGRWAEFTVEGVVQRLRWIEPGEFWMGSPDSEIGRSNDETRHRVKLSQGYWLADTACTQALWLAVRGDNPSHFSDDMLRPVEQVSADDIHVRLLPALNRLLPGLDACLPTEAQWEHACRAGTQTAFSFGDQINPTLVNYDGNYTYAGSAKGEHRKKPVTVKRLPPNAWGLFEMHGNVWEWCADGYGAYGAAEVEDPVGEVGDVRLVLRGGSWDNVPAHTRSSVRACNRANHKSSGIGFRLSRATQSNR